MNAAAQHRPGVAILKGLRIAVQGVGHVGYYLCRHLAAEGAELIVADIAADCLDRARREFDAHVVAPDAIAAAAVDIYAPCELGAAIHDASLPQIKANIVAGSDQHQHADPPHGEAPRKPGILYP